MKSETNAGRQVLLAPRLQMIADLVPAADRLCDVGCDHAHIPLWLLKTGRIHSALAMDVIPGPLKKAGDNLALYATEDEKDRIELRLSDGLDAFRSGEAQVLVIAGMGGWLIRKILLREPDKTRSFSALVLQPQSDPEQVRDALRELSMVIEDEAMALQDGKFYQALRAVPAGEVESTGTLESADKTASSGTAESAGTAEKEPQEPLWPSYIEEDIRGECALRFGPVLLERRDPVLKAFLMKRRSTLKTILAQLLEKGRDAAVRDQAVRLRRELACVEAALSIYE